MTLRVLIAVTHLLGAGHLARSAALARAFAAKGHAVTLVSGGMPAPLIGADGVNLVQLPPIRTEGTDFRTLLDEAGQRAGEPLMAERRERLRETLRAVSPDVVVTELFPFGRRALAGEFLALLEAAHARVPRPLVACSIRDILVAPTKPGRVEETHERLLRFYDLVLVHGDPALASLEESWPVSNSIRPMLSYTGYVDDGSPVPSSSDRQDILVSGGSSAASLPLYRAALEAARLSSDRSWRVLAGNGVPERDFAGLMAAVPPNVTLERARRDFRALLGRAALSVSQAGYNTVVDLLRTRTPAVLVPFEAGRETEQRLRAECLSARGLARIVPEAELTAERLAEAVREGLLSHPPAVTIALDGARRSVAVVEQSVTARPALAAGIDWSALDDALRRSRDQGREIGFWWRDDDAVAETPALRRLLALSLRHEAPVALAAIPRALDPTLRECLEEAPLAVALVHGLAHANHAPGGEKKAEFGHHRPLAAMEEDAAEALRLARAGLGATLLPVFVPPWNRMSDGLAAALPRLGYRGVSTFNDRPTGRGDPALVRINAHIDPIDWRGTRGLVDPAQLARSAAAAVERRSSGLADADEPIGLLTHHLAQDEAVWWFCEALIERLARNNVRLRHPVRLFSGHRGIDGEA